MDDYICREAVNQIIAAQCGECADACLEFDGIQPDCNQCKGGRVMKSDFINCKNCTDDCRCKGKDITPICISFKPAKTTNADRIRAMSDEELAGWLDQIDGVGMFPGQTQWLDWLKQEVTE